MTRLMHVSDLHFGAEVPEAVEGLLAAVAAHRPDGVVIGGDFTMRARRREWEAARRFLDRLDGIGAPWMAIPGNHDIPAFNHPWHRLFHPFKRYRRWIAENDEPVEVLGNVEVAGLNTARRFGGGRTWDWSHGAVSVAQCLALPFRFGGGAALRAVMIHHPLLAPPGQERRLLRRDGLLLAALEKAEADLLLAGHFHRSHTGLLKLPLGSRDIVLSHVSTACSWRTKGEPMGFHVIEAEEGSMEVARWDFGRDGFAEASRRRFVKSGEAGSWREG